MKGPSIKKGSILPKFAAIVYVATLLSALSGCGVLNGLGLAKPSAKIAGVSIKDIGMDSATLLFDVEVKNPYSLPLPLVAMDYGLASTGQQFLTGRSDLQGTVPANGTKTLPLSAKVSYLELLKAVKDVRPGAVMPYAAQLGLSVNAPGIGPLRLPLNKQGELPIPAKPDVKVAEIKWQKVALDEVTGLAKLSLINRNQFPVDLTKLVYAMSLGDVEVARSALVKNVAFGADGGAGEIEIPLSFSPQQMGMGFLRMLTGSGAGYKFGGTMEVGTPFGPMSLPMEKVGNTIFRR
ncbi:MAG: LEA type 2 family protein [Planctomycetes bacterium]|nr:LEA type 2 family protein [Planctomycetota bacterium]